METSFFWFGVFSGSFGVRSIVLCKCSGKYIDIYFELKITYIAKTRKSLHRLADGWADFRYGQTAVSDISSHQNGEYRFFILFFYSSLSFT